MNNIDEESRPVFHFGLSENIQDLISLPPVEQAKFWTSCVQSVQGELQSLGGLPSDHFHNDVLTRYFDSSSRGLSLVFDCALRDQNRRHQGATERRVDPADGKTYTLDEFIGKSWMSFDGKAAARSYFLNKCDPTTTSTTDTESLDIYGLYYALSEHYNFFDVLEDEKKEAFLKGINVSKISLKDSGVSDFQNTNDDKYAESFARICWVVGLPCHRESFGHAVRRLRIAALLDLFNLHSQHRSHSDGKVYHCDYDDDNIYTQFNCSKKTQKVVHGRKYFNIPIVEPQVHNENLAEYLFVHQSKKAGRVHWVHVQFPSIELLMAIGQLWRLPGPDLTLLCHMKKAMPQVSLDRTEGRDDKYGYKWSSLIMPAIYLDKSAQESLDIYRNWFDLTQDPRHTDVMSRTPPRIRIAVTSMNLCMLWSSEKANTVVTIASEAHYIGKWNTDVKQRSVTNWFHHVVSYLTCAGCCGRRSNDKQKTTMRRNTEDPDEKTPLIDKDLENQLHKDNPELAHGHEERLEMSAELKALLDEEMITMMGEKATNSSESCIQFETMFPKVLQSLERQNSMLRLGNHMQLLMRIMSNRTVGYLDVLDLYEAAIARLSHLLHDDSRHDKDDLIAKIELAKLELNALDRLVKPLSDYVVAELMDVAMDDKMKDDYPLVFHHVKDVQNNIRTFLPKCSALIDSCTNLTIEYDRDSSDKMNNVLNILTFITFVITPMQLMTGLYGMNFRIIPELNWHYGYLYFWCLSITLSILFAMMLVCLKR